MDDAGAAVIILAGGKATRFPGKLERPIGDVPMLAHIYRSVQGLCPTYICLSADSDLAHKLQLDAEILVDREPLRGPLPTLLDAFEVVRELRAFVVAADMPFVQANTLREIAEHWKSDDEAVVALDEEGRPQPLLALYDRKAFVRAAASLDSERDGVKDTLRHLRWRGITLRESSALANINTEDQYRAVTA